MTDQVVFEHIFLRLILSDCLPTTGAENLSETSKSFNHFHTMLLHVEPNIACELFQNNLHYVSQITMPIECMSQFLFFAVTNQLHVLSTIPSLCRNCTAYCRDPDVIIREHKDALPLQLLAKINRFLHHCKPKKIIGHVTADQHRQSCACGKYASVSKNMTKVETTLKK